MRVFIYFNLNKHCLSLKALEGPQRGRVILHAQAACVKDVEFWVSEAGRQRVLRERCKNVHAGVVGRLEGHVPIGATVWVGPMPGIPVTYDPYKGPHFVERATQVPVFRASWAYAHHRDVRILR